MPIDFEIHKKFHKKIVETKYKPISLLELLTNVRKISDILIDVSFYVYLTKDQTATDHLIEIANKAKSMFEQATIHAAILTRDIKDAKNVLGIYKYASSIEKIIDSTLDIAYIGLTDHNPREDVANLMMNLSDELTVKIVANKKIQKEIIEIQDKYPIDVMFLIRENKLEIFPLKKIKEGDILYIRGNKESINKFLKENDYEKIKEKYVSEDVKKLIIKVVYLKDAVKTLLDLAHHALISVNQEISNEIDEMEMIIDTYHIELMEEIIKKSPIKDPLTNLSLIWFINKLEEITDATEEIALTVITDPEIREVFKIISESIGEKSIIIKVLKDTNLQNISSELLKYGSYIPAIKTKKEWIIQTKWAKRDISIKKGDLLLILYPNEFEEEIKRTIKAFT